MKLTSAIALLGLLVLGACAPAGPPRYTMAQVMAQCDASTDFGIYLSCIKQSYSAQGTTPGAQPILSFYAQLDALAEQNVKKQITYVEAKAAAYRAYDATIGVSNRANKPVTCVDFGFGVVQCR